MYHGIQGSAVAYHVNTITLGTAMIQKQKYHSTILKVHIHIVYYLHDHSKNTMVQLLTNHLNSYLKM